jgi:hypothetical protein
LPLDGNPGYNLTGAAGTFYVRVRAMNACGNSVSNEVAVMLTNECVVPGPIPFIDSYDAGPGRLWPEWESAAGPGLAASYRINVGSAPGQSDVTSLVVDGRRSSAGPVGVPYRQIVEGVTVSPSYLSVTPMNACGPGPRSYELAVSSCSVPRSSLSASVEGRQVRLQLQRVAFPELESDVVVEVGRSLYAADVLRQTSRTSVQDSWLTVELPPGRYYARARNVASCGLGHPSRELMFVIEP